MRKVIHYVLLWNLPLKGMFKEELIKQEKLDNIYLKQKYGNYLFTV